MKEKGLYFEYKDNSIFLYEVIKRKDKWKNKKCLFVANKNIIEFKKYFNIESYKIINNIYEISDMFSRLYNKDFKQSLFQYPIIDNEKLMILEILKFLNQKRNLNIEEIKKPIIEELKTKKLNNIYEYMDVNKFKLNKIFNNGIYSDLFIDFNANEMTDLISCSPYLLSLINIRMNKLGLNNFQKYTFNVISFFRYIYSDNLNYYLELDNEELRKIFDAYMDIYDSLQVNIDLYSKISETAYCLVYIYGKENVLYYLELIKTFLDNNKLDKFHNYILTIYWLKRLFLIIPPSLTVLPDTLNKWSYLDNYLEFGNIERYKILERYKNILLYDDVKINSEKYFYKNNSYKICVEESFSQIVKISYDLKYDFSNVWRVLYNKEGLLVIKNAKNEPIAIITIKGNNIIGFYEYNTIKESIMNDINNLLKEYTSHYHLSMIRK